MKIGVRLKYMEYKVLSREACEKYAARKHKKQSVVISIRSSWDKILPIIPIGEFDNMIQDVLYLDFCDIEFIDVLKYKSDKGYITHSQAKMIVEFVEKWYDRVDLIIVHCDGGISRSTGVCSAIMRWYEGDDSRFFRSRYKFPNISVYLAVLDEFRNIENVSICREQIKETYKDRNR